MNYRKGITGPTGTCKCFVKIKEVHKLLKAHSTVYQTDSEVTDLAAREFVALLHGVRSPLPLLVPGLCPLLCPLLSLWEVRGEVKASGVLLSGSVLTNPGRGRR